MLFWLRYGNTPFLSFFLHGTFGLASLSESTTTTFWLASLLILSAAFILLYLASEVDRRSRHYSREREKIHIFVLHIILHGYGQTILGYDADLIFSEISIMDSPIGLVMHVLLLRRGIQVLIQFTHLTDTIGILNYATPKGFHNVIVNVLQVILKGGTMIFSNSNQIYFYKLSQRSTPISGLPPASVLTTLAQSPKLSMLMSFASTRAH